MMKLSWALAGAMLAGCSTYGPPQSAPGDPLDKVESQLGPPTGRYALPDGNTRVEWARGPYGKHTFMVDVDARNKVLGWRQVLTEPIFAEVQPGWSEVEVLRLLGRPSERHHIARMGGETWSWRYDAVFCQWFQASMVAGAVQSAGYAPDPMCEDNTRSRRK